MAGEERTKEVFGEYVSIYNFKESVDDRTRFRFTTRTAFPNFNSPTTT
jgi:type I restriction enzyme, R subunit